MKPRKKPQPTRTENWLMDRSRVAEALFICGEIVGTTMRLKDLEAEEVAARCEGLSPEYRQLVLATGRFRGQLEMLIGTATVISTRKRKVVEKKPVIKRLTQKRESR